MHSELAAGTQARILKGGSHLFSRIAGVLWVAGWTAIATGIVAQSIRGGLTPGLSVNAALWGGVGSLGLVAIVWLLTGKREVLVVTGRMVQLVRALGPFGRMHHFEGTSIRALRVFAAGGGALADYRALIAFWDRGAGRVAFDVSGRTYAFGSSLDDEAVQGACAMILAQFPGANVEPSDVEPDSPRSRRRSLGWLAHVTSWIIAAAIIVPARSVVADLPTCTGGAFVGAYVPVDPRQLRPTGRVVLVPFGDFAFEEAAGIAERFRTRYALDISVGTPLPIPDDAFVVERGQLDSGVLLSALDQRYPSSSPVHTVAIGLTHADMFIKELSWKYAFSNRRPPGLAVVSSARMDHGCMGIVVADSETQMARLRKMIGKNIGVLVYGLPLSDHPRSMMYRSIGGPQELDVMLEEF
jgi:hypothetical protein